MTNEQISTLLALMSAEGTTHASNLVAQATGVAELAQSDPHEAGTPYLDNGVIRLSNG